MCVYRPFVMYFVGHHSFYLCAPVHSCAFLGVPMTYRAFTMHLNWTLSEIIRQSCAILCVPYGLELAFVVDSPIICVISVIDLNWTYSDVRYRHESVLECPIIYIVSLQIDILMPYYFYHKSLIWSLNSTFCWQLSQLLLRVLLLINWRIHCERYYPILILGFQHQRRNSFYLLWYCLYTFSQIHHCLNFLIYCCVVLIRMLPFSTTKWSLS